MRDLTKSLELFEREFAMDYCEEFNRVKAVLEHMHRNSKPFNRLHFRSGNEQFITEAVRRMQDVFAELHLIDNNTKEPLAEKYHVHRKIVLFLIANTDATYKYDMRQNALMAHVMELCPLMPKFLLCSLVWELHLERFFFELLAYGPCWLTFQFVEAAVDSLKYVRDPFDVLAKVEQLLQAILIGVTRSRLLDLDRVDTKCILGKLYDAAISLLRQFYTPDAEKLENLKKARLQRYKGFALKYLLQQVLVAMNLYEEPNKAEPSLDITIYDILHMGPKPLVGSAIREGAFKEHLKMILNSLLNSLQFNIMLVDLDTFLSWVEIETDECASLQQNIGEMAHAVGERMQANENFQHDVSQQIGAISIQPKTFVEIRAEATIRDILLNLDKPSLDPETKAAWLDELFTRKLALGNDECLQSIQENVRLLKKEHCLQMLDFMHLEMERLKEDDPEYMVSSEDFEALVQIMQQTLTNLTCSDLVAVLSHQRRLFAACLDLFSGPGDTEKQMNTLLNKCANDFDVCSFLRLSFANQDVMWQHLFTNACVQQAHLDNFDAVMQATGSFSDAHVERLLNAAIEDDERILEKLFPQLLGRIFFAKYHPNRQLVFLKEVINKRLATLVEVKKYEVALPLVKALLLIDSRGETQTHKPLNFGTYTPPLLVMIAQTMDKARWDLVTYTTPRDEFVRECIQLVQKVSKKFLPVASEKDRKWLVKAICEKQRPLTKFYFQKYSLKPHEAQVDFDQFLISNESVENTEPQVFLIKNFVRCTMKETEWLARNDVLLSNMSDVMILLSKIVNSHDVNAINSYLNCLTNYANIVMKFLLPQAANDAASVEKLLMSVLKIINSSPDSVYNEVFMNFESLVLEVVRQGGGVLTEDSTTAVRTYVSGMRECQAQRIFLEKFIAAVTETTN